MHFVTLKKNVIRKKTMTKHLIFTTTRPKFKTPLILFLFCLLFMASCIEDKSMPKNQEVIEKVIVQFYPSFIDPSIITLNLVDSSVIFQRVGSIVMYYVRTDPNVATKEESPKSFSYKLDENTYRYFRDSLHYDAADFVDREVDSKDGIFNTILYVPKNGWIKDVDLNGCVTDNQRNLITKLIESSKNHTLDSLTLSYLDQLKLYY